MSVRRDKIERREKWIRIFLNSEEEEEEEDESFCSPTYSIEKTINKKSISITY